MYREFDLLSQSVHGLWMASCRKQQLCSKLTPQCLPKKA
uniref:Uncharacterized protein n=1 Tax=Rhizophora mucronata TaxID=61149 RepID=A0A2P2P6M7_RHIMU